MLELQDGIHHLSDVQWRVDIILSTSSAAKVLRPSVLMRLELKNGRVQMLDLNCESFGQLRCRVAELLAEMEAVEDLLKKEKRPLALRHQELKVSHLKITDQSSQL